MRSRTAGSSYSLPRDRVTRDGRQLPPSLPDDVAAPPAAAAVFGARLPLAEQYAHFLASAGLERGMIGPREVPRLWERHLLNCAVVSELLPAGARVVDVGSGAGLPGIVLAIRRPDLTVDCVDSIQRRTDFLTEAVELLGLADQVRVVTGRIEDAAVLAAVGDAEWMTARAVAPIDRLMAWSVPALRDGGCLLAIKGATAEAELARSRPRLRRIGSDPGVIVTAGAGLVAEPTTVVILRKAAVAVRRGGSGKGGHV